jgi:methionine--tRNA ligase beta chain
MFQKLDLRIGRILSVADHPEGETLYVLKVDIGDETRELVAGLKQWYNKKELTGKNVVVLANLAAADIRGIISKGMLLAAKGKKRVAILTAEGTPGEAIVVEGVDRKPAESISLKEFQKTKIHLSNENTAIYKNKVLKTNTGTIHAEKKIGAGARIL